VGINGVPRSGFSGNNLNFSPRIGFAYRVANKTVFHAGFGTYYSAPNVTNSSGLSANVPVDNYWAFNNSSTYGAATTGTPFNFAANGYAHTVITSATALLPKTPAYGQDPNARTLYSEQWHATIEQKIPFATVLKFAYVGTRGVHLDDLRDINAGQLGVAGATSQRTLAEWFNPAAFANPAPGTWGNSGRNILQGPGSKNVDFPSSRIPTSVSANQP
jgi:hypothetical protein